MWPARASADVCPVGMLAPSELVATSPSTPITPIKGYAHLLATRGERMTPESVLKLHVPNDSGGLVPLSAFVTTKWEEGPVQMSRYNGYPSIRITGDAAPGVSTGEAMAELERIIGELPAGIGYEWTGLSYQERVASGQALMLFALAIVVVFLLLVALYESWAIPLTVMLIVPSERSMARFLRLCVMVIPKALTKKLANII